MHKLTKNFIRLIYILLCLLFLTEIGLYGFANWTKVQAREEVDHGMILFDYIIERDGTIDLQQINSPDRSFENPLQVFEKILDHEKYVTESINCVAYMSDDECDLATRHFINWYISEQVEEEANALDIIKKLKMFGEDKASLYQLDKDLGTRTYQQHSYKSE